ncbi:MAG: HAMP domain-containing histidine kinase [Treponema sp.]|jgi:signal transduction histidine kinase|nr:HAMP domain-containing histidine kinase [Treponema sp.]
MKERKFAVSLQNRLALTYALFTGFALAVLAFVINVSTGLIFTALVKDNIAEETGEIIRVMEEQYNPMRLAFDAAAIEAAGMHFVHEGYIITVEDGNGGLVWDARTCDMRECMTVIGEIAGRMKGQFGVSGAMREDRYPLRYAGRTVGTVSVETYGPYFYSETEGKFLATINRLLTAAAIVITAAGFVISVVLSRAIARPVNKSAGAARQIARAHSENTGGRPPAIRIDDHYHTRELAELARSINSLAACLEEAERRQQQLVSDIAHELRTPLTCLQGDIEAMIDGVYKPDREHLESCHEEIIRLAGLVNDLRTLTSLEWENLALNKTEFDLADLLRITAEQFRAAAFEKGIEIHLRLAESPVVADYDRLKQVFINLLSNAVKYTDTGAITLTVEKAAVPGAQWEVSVADTGSGMAENDLPHVFERFYRADKSRGRDTGGAGVGLAIAAAIVRAHGGTISAGSPGTETSAGRGSIFRVIL